MWVAQSAGELWGTHWMFPPHTAQPWATGDWQDALINPILIKQFQFLSGAKQSQGMTTPPVPHLLSLCTAGHRVTVPAAAPEGRASVKLASAGAGFAFWLQNKQTNPVQCTKGNFEVPLLCSLGYNVLKAPAENCRSPDLRGKGGSRNWSKEFTQCSSLQSIVYICKPCSCKFAFLS